MTDEETHVQPAAGGAAWPARVNEMRHLALPKSTIADIQPRQSHRSLTSSLATGAIADMANLALAYADMTKI